MNQTQQQLHQEPQPTTESLPQFLLRVANEMGKGANRYFDSTAWLKKLNDDGYCTVDDLKDLINVKDQWLAYYLLPAAKTKIVKLLTVNADSGRKRVLQTNDDLEYAIRQIAQQVYNENKSPSQTTSGTDTEAEFGYQIKRKCERVRFETFGLPSLNIQTYRDLFTKKDQNFLFDKLKSSYQIMFMEKMNQINLPYDAVDTSCVTYLDGRKPDVSYFIKTRPQVPIFQESPMNVVVLGELKISKELKTNKTIGQVVTFCHRLIAQSPARSFCYSFITDCSKIAFIKTTFDPKKEEQPYTYEITKFEDLVAGDSNSPNPSGLQHLLELLHADKSLLGYSNPEFKHQETILPVISKLGYGLTSSVWASNDMVIKHYRTKYISLIKNEVDNLTKLSQVDGIPRLIGQENDYIIIKPLGKQLKLEKNLQLETLYHYIQIIPILKNVHSLGLVHRDVRLTNVMKVDDKVYLNDWGHAVKINQIVDDKLSYHCAADDISHGTTYALPYHDLVMVVKVCWMCLFSNIHLRLQKKPPSVIKFWNSELVPFYQDFQKALKFAIDLKYDELFSYLKKLLGYVMNE